MTTQTPNPSHSSLQAAVTAPAPSPSTLTPLLPVPPDTQTEDEKWHRQLPVLPLHQRKEAFTHVVTEVFGLKDYNPIYKAFIHDSNEDSLDVYRLISILPDEIEKLQYPVECDSIGTTDYLGNGYKCLIYGFQSYYQELVVDRNYRPSQLLTLTFDDFDTYKYKYARNPAAQLPTFAHFPQSGPTTKTHVLEIRKREVNAFAKLKDVSQWSSWKSAF